MLANYAGLWHAMRPAGSAEGKAVRIAIAHNRYQQGGGEDKVVAAEVKMLRQRGHDVEQLDFDNEAITGARGRAKAALSSFYSFPSHRRVTAVLASFRPEVLHVHNFMPTLSPSVFFAAQAEQIPVVQTLHNYRLLCANAQMFREGAVCERCVEERSFLPAVRLGCYRGSRTGSAVVGGTVALHARLGTWEKRVARYIALSSFAAAKLGARLPPEKIRIKGNFVADGGRGGGQGGYALFVGRLSAEKGVGTLLEADASGELPMPLQIAGDGPMREAVERACSASGSRLRYLGPQSGAGVRELMAEASTLVVPSLWLEGFPMVMVEAMSLGLPVIASGIGSLPEIVQDGITGMLTPPGDAGQLVRTLARFEQLSPAQKEAMRAAARERSLSVFGEEANYKTLMGIYAEALLAA